MNILGGMSSLVLLESIGNVDCGDNSDVSLNATWTGGSCHFIKENLIILTKMQVAKEMMGIWHDGTAPILVDERASVILSSN